MSFTTKQCYNVVSDFNNTFLYYGRLHNTTKRLLWIQMMDFLIVYTIEYIFQKWC